MSSNTSLYTPRPLQYDIRRNMKRFSVLVCHRRFGKTVFSVNRLIEDAVSTSRPDWRGAYIAPLYKQAKTVVWDYLKHFLSNRDDVKFRESELRCDFENGSRIRLYGANNPDSLRGIYLDGVVFDEVAQMPYRVWGEIIRPALTDRKGWALFIGTPQGKNALYEIWEKARNNKEWYAALHRASETGVLDDAELADARDSMSPEEYEQEFECSFSAAIRGAYFGPLLADLDRAGRIGDVPWDPALPVHTSWDLGMSDSTAIWFSQTDPGGGHRFIDYYEASGEGLAHYAGVLKQKGYYYGRHIAPHDIRVRELGTGKSRLEVAASLGIRFSICPNIPLQDGISAVRDLLPRCRFDAVHCGPGIDSLRHYRREFNDRMNDFMGRPRHDWTSHGVDAFRYFAVGYRPEGNRPSQQRAVNEYRPFR